MKTKSLAWYNGESLYAEHLRKNNTELEKFITNLKSNNYFGIKSLIIDDQLLLNGLLKVVKIEAIFPDGSYVNYDNSMYDLSFNLELLKNQMHDSKKFYLGFDNIFLSDQTIELDNGQLVSFKYEEPKLLILSDKTEISMAFLELKINNGIIQSTDFLGPRLTVEQIINGKRSVIYEELNSLIIFMKNTLNSMRDREYLTSENNEYVNNILFIQELFYTIGKLQTFINNSGTTFDLYILLNEIIGMIGWKHLSTFPLIQQFDPENWVFISKSIINLIYETINGNNIGHKSSIFRRESDFFVINVNTIEDENPVIIIDPNTIDVRNWIENTCIGSEKFISDVRRKRIRGIKREIIQSSRDLLLVSLDRSSEFLCNNNNLMIYINPNIKINNISLSLKNT